MTHNGLKKIGAPSLEELKNSSAFPQNEDFMNGPIAVIECIEEIPCNPCETSCPKGSITIGKPITNLPRIDFKKCSGCGICVAACPGLAIYIKDYTFSEEKALITFPFEYVPLPEIGDIVTLVDRQGQDVCPGIVTKINKAKAFNQTALITVKYSKEYFENVISMKRKIII
ncbi:MAG: 4Fe-4S binding protein [Thermotaleaceae bacterium]